MVGKGGLVESCYQMARLSAGRKLARDDACRIPGPSPQGQPTEERVAPSDGVEVWARYPEFASLGTVPLGTIANLHRY